MRLLSVHLMMTMCIILLKRIIHQPKLNRDTGIPNKVTVLLLLITTPGITAPIVKMIIIMATVIMIMEIITTITIPIMIIMAPLLAIPITRIPGTVMMIIMITLTVQG